MTIQTSRVPLSRLTYPGNGTGFFMKGDWSKDFNQEDDCTLCREIELSALDKKAFITKINLRGYKDGNIVLTVYTRETATAIELFEKFISDCGLTQDKARFAGSNGYMATSLSEIRYLFRVLRNYNSFSYIQRESILSAIK